MLEDNLTDYQQYLEEPISDRPSERVRNALLLAIVNSLNSNSRLDSVAATTNSVSPSLEIIENTGDAAIARTISNAKMVSIFIKSGSGTVLGATVDEAIAAIDLPYVKERWTDINYTVNPNSTFVILVGE